MKEEEKKDTSMSLWEFAQLLEKRGWYKDGHLTLKGKLVKRLYRKWRWL